MRDKIAKTLQFQFAVTVAGQVAECVLMLLEAYRMQKLYGLV